MFRKIIFFNSNKIMNIVIYSLKIQFRPNLDLKCQNKINNYAYMCYSFVGFSMNYLKKS